MTEQKKEEGFSPEFEKVLEAIDNWKVVNSEGKSFIASFAEHDEKGNPIGDTMILGFGFKDVCRIHLEIFEKELNEAKVEDDALPILHGKMLSLILSGSITFTLFRNFNSNSSLSLNAKVDFPDAGNPTKIIRKFELLLNWIIFIKSSYELNFLFSRKSFNF